MILSRNRTLDTYNPTIADAVVGRIIGRLFLPFEAFSTRMVGLVR